MSQQEIKLADTLIALAQQQVGLLQKIANPSLPLVPILGLQANLGADTVIVSGAPGANASVSVPANEIWDIQGIFITFAADNNAGNRTFNLEFDNNSLNGQFVFKTNICPTITATQSAYISYESGWGTMETSFDANLAIRLPLPEFLRLLPNYFIQTRTSGLQVGDTYYLLIRINRWRIVK